MKKIYTALLSLTLLAASPAMATHRVMQPAIASSAVNAAAELRALSRVGDQTTTSEWTACPGTWVYVSNYTKKSYATTVETRQTVTGDDNALVTEYKLSNALFKDAVLSCNPAGGRLRLRTADNDAVELLNENGEGTGKYIYSTNMSKRGIVTNRMQYPAAESFKLDMFVVPKTDSGEYDYDRLENITYDYFYNTEAAPCGVSVNFPTVIDSQLSLNGTCGSGVTDLYYMVGISTRNQDEAEKFSGDANIYGLPVTYETMPAMLTEYIATGKMNSAVKIGKINTDASGSFNVAIAETWEGMCPVAIFGLKDGEICAQEQGLVEMHNKADWKAYKEGSVYLNVIFDGIPNPPIDVAESSEVEINEKAKQLRFTNPYGDTPSPENYLYLDYTLGLDKCFLTDSYSPVTFSATTYGADFQPTTTDNNPVYMRSIASYNIATVGSTPELIYKNLNHYGFYDLSTEAPDIQPVMQMPSQYYYSDGIYTVSPAGNITLIQSGAAGIEVDPNYTMTITMADVSSVEFAFINKDNPEITSKTYSVKNEGFLINTFSIAECICNNEIPKEANAIKYSFFDKNEVVKSGIMPLEISLDVEFANVEFDEEIMYNKSGLRRCGLTTSEGGNPMVTLYNFTEGYYSETPDLQIEFISGVPEFMPYYMQWIDSNELGDVLLYMTASDESRAQNVVTAILAWDYYQNDEIFGDYGSKSGVTITLPEHYILDSGIELTGTDAERMLPAVYFNLQGQRVTTPERGNLYIECRGAEARKIIF